ncbi:MAG: DUF1080 domain-containing protein [Planctomycetales bacterium]|nr:DUF1080 domain-containing protein [Planctomycetales bacterium]
MRHLHALFLCGLVSLSVVARAQDHRDAPELEEGYVSLFDGKTLEGWDGDPKLWTVVDGAITGTSSDEAPLTHNQFLIWKSEVADFALRLEFRVDDRGVGNSGIQYRSRRHPDVDKWVVGGYQADIDRSNRYMGILYEERGRGILAERGQKVVVRPVEEPAAGTKPYVVDVVGSVGDPAEIVADVKPGEWVAYEIVAQGNRLVHKVAGRTTVEVVDEDSARSAARGVLALQLHQGPAMRIQFRRIRLKTL